MTKPTVKPQWATDGSAIITEPSLAKKQQGWKSPEKPSDGVTNWLNNSNYQWINWLDENTDGDYKIGRRLTAGSNVTLTDNGDETERIDVSLTVTTVPSIGESFTQSSHGFSVKDQIRFNGSSWVKTQANSVTGASNVWTVSSVLDTNNFTATMKGRITITGHGLTVGTLYYLSSTSAGALTATKPVGSTSVPLGFYLPCVFIESSSVIHVLGNSMPTFTPVLAEFSAGSAVGSVSFTGLAGIATDGSYELDINVKHNTGSDYYWVQLNGEAVSNYSFQKQRNANTTITATRGVGSGNSESLQAIGTGGITAGTFKIQRIATSGYLINVHGGSGTSGSDLELQSSQSLRSLSSDISSIQLISTSGSSIQPGSTFTLKRSKW